MTDEVLNSLERRKLLTGLGTAAIGGVAAGLVKSAHSRTGLLAGMALRELPGMPALGGRPC